MKATAKDLRVHSKGLLDAVSKGEDVVITFRGKPCARLVPYEEVDKTTVLDNKDELFGIWADRVDIESVEEYMQNLRKGRFF
ncbi:type II toxin-antitoxin system prevent-host-death family antitoxin [Methylobacter sp. G7]|uniref:type II toxin-antitoxin system Phd/YefM family antitoxin n=1 Tax=Methylobacter sp. G7 TaxID=3230117 RepID=UPI003D809DF3